MWFNKVGTILLWVVIFFSIIASLGATMLPNNITEAQWCANFSNSCNGCMSTSESIYNVSCSWRQYDTIDMERCIPTSQCNANDFFDDINTINHCCTHKYCCQCLQQSSCKMCGAQGLNQSCSWDHTITSCFQSHTCIDGHKCLENPSLTECEYPNGICKGFFAKKRFWVLCFCGMIVFSLCLPCCLYHMCGIDWDSEFDDRYTLQRGDGYIFKGGAPITGKCMYISFFVVGIFFLLLALFGAILAITCEDQSY